MSGEWPLSEEQMMLFWQFLRDTSLDELVDEAKGITKLTQLGMDLQVETFMAFVGAIDVWEAPRVLEIAGLVSEEEVHGVFVTKSESKLRGFVASAYLRFCNRSAGLN